MKYLSVDLGDRRTGIAVGNDELNIAHPLTVLEVPIGNELIHSISQLMQEHEIDGLVLGLPLNMDGSESELSTRARKFARRLEGRFGIQVKMVDERLTSQEAKSLLREQSQNQRGRNDDLTKIDHIAAALILQSWLDDQSLGRAI